MASPSVAKPAKPAEQEEEPGIEESKAGNKTQPAVSKPPELSLAPTGDPAAQQAARIRAEASVQKAAQQLAAVDRTKLDGRNARDYDLVTGVLKGAQKALDDNDFTRAQSLARKASVLASQLAGRVAGAP